MKSIVAVAVALAYAQSVFGFTVNTPTNVVQCQPILITWADGVPPYFPSIIPGGQPSAPALKTFDTTSATSLTWNVDIGGSITIALKDSTGATAFTDIVNIQSSPSGSCASSSGAASAPPATGSTPATVGTTSAGSAVASGSKPAAAPTSAAGASSPARPSASGSQAAASSAKPSSGAVRTSVTYGFAGVLAAVGIALA